jgi:hypothetical protein
MDWHRTHRAGWITLGFALADSVVGEPRAGRSDLIMGSAAACQGGIWQAATKENLHDIRS